MPTEPAEETEKISKSTYRVGDWSIEIVFNLHVGVEVFMPKMR